MEKHLFDEDYRYTIDAQELDKETIQKVEDLFDEYVKYGYSPREIEYIMYSAIKDISLQYTV